MRNPFVLVCSVETELSPLITRLGDVRPFSCGDRTAWLGQVDAAPCIALAAGMGKTNAAHALTALLGRVEVAAVVGFGVGGAYQRSGLAIGDVAIATSEVYGDEGVETPDGWISCEGIGIPLVDSPEPGFNHFSVDDELSALFASDARNGAGMQRGSFVTVSCCSGTSARGDALADRFGAICESMEGAAYAHIAALYSLPFAEIRGISNLVVDRDLSAWKLQEAADAAAERVMAGLEHAASFPMGGQSATPQ